MVVLVQKSLLIGDAPFHIVNALHIGKVGADTGIGERPVLIEGFRLKRGGKVGEWIAARVVVKVIAPNEGSERKHCSVIDQAGPRRGNVEGFDL